ncbi:putative transcriptional regulatory protein pdtaR [Roseivivax sp. THAF40]|uniref:response regulator n=1 Tax=unclassified Roseivivax TaxID=2639302 RepID=UPI00126852C5|nr:MULTISPECIES: response regulator [unclassified Roseivivax]QFS83081.1 putative transcriptional regulatory protein pdtaR [Roseivivax sp. THAF197b]QFT46825.1 putative transcriptional regulatory protein pdtaR [Roseivivax sp. THAF40]
MSQTDLSSEIGQALPYLRRYARALTGSQSTGDQYAAATLEAVLADRSITVGASRPKVGLFQTFHGIWVTTGAPVTDEDTGPLAAAQRHMSRLTTNSREALLLHTIEEFTLAEVGEVMNVGTEEAEILVQTARQEMADAMSGRVLIIEDEAIIAMDLESIVADLGHRVTGVARTRDGAVALGAKETPDLILADIQLADNSSGVDAVNDLLRDLGERPVIFITAFPERLLTGDKPEPAFLISKPYSEEQVRSAISQAMFFSSTETLRA